MIDVIIKIQSSQDVGDGPDKMEFTTDGHYNETAGGFELCYLESELTGLEGTGTTFTVEDGCVTMTRSGIVNSSMIFEEGRRHYFVYGTPYGDITMAVDTHCITSRTTDDGGELEIVYIVDMGNSTVSRNRFLINYTEVQED